MRAKSVNEYQKRIRRGGVIEKGGSFSRCSVTQRNITLTNGGRDFHFFSKTEKFGREERKVNEKRNFHSGGQLHNQIDTKPENGEQVKKKFNLSLLSYLACPISKSKLVYSEEKNELISTELLISFPINEKGIPNFILSESRPLSLPEIDHFQTFLLSPSPSSQDNNNNTNNDNNNNNNSDSNSDNKTQS